MDRTSNSKRQTSSRGFTSAVKGKGVLLNVFNIFSLPSHFPVVTGFSCGDWTLKRGFTVNLLKFFFITRFSQNKVSVC